jgi:RecB family exonuclease
LREIGRTDADLRCARALDALREAPTLWSARGAPRTAVLFYGFDDLTAPQLDAVETLACVVDAPVTVALSYEPGRVAFAEPAAAFQALLPLASRHVAVPPATRHYAPAARRALAHLERRLFDPGAAAKRGARIDPGAAIALLEGGGERAELELVAAEIRALLDAGMDAREVALVHRSPELVWATIAEVFPAYGVPYALRRTASFAEGALGRGLIAMLRCALLDADSRELLTWLRTPGAVEDVGPVDGLELALERRGVRDAGQARSLWERQHGPLIALDRVRAAAERGPCALIESVDRELWSLFCGARRGDANELGAQERAQADAFRAASAALASLRELAEQVSGPPLLADPAELIGTLEDLDVPPASLAELDAVPVLRPLELRARRVRALFLCGLQEGVFPAPAKPPPFLDEQERRSLAETSGLALERPRDWLARERYLLYACVSRPQERLVLSWHTADDDANATARSLFVDDICDLFDERLLDERRRRSLGAIDAIPAAEPSCEGAGPAIGPLADERLLHDLRAERLWSASSLGAFAGCPVRWFVEHMLRPESLEPESEALACGRAVHAVLADVMDSLRREYGSARVTPERLTRARELAMDSIDRQCAEVRLSVVREEHAALRRRMHADIERFLEHAASDDSALEPSYLELSFGFEGEEEDGDGSGPAALPALDLGAGVRVRGRIDRIDVGPRGEAVVYDYKRRGGLGAPPGEKWTARRSFQVALYMRAARDLLALRPIGGFYQPVTGEDLRARGVLAEGAAAPSMRSDRYDPAELDALVEEAISLARNAASRAAAGALEPCPRTCSPSGQRCMYPTICRCEP